MKIHELFEDDEDGDTGVVQELRDAILDMLTPLAAQGIPKVSVQAVIDALRNVHSGVAVDRALVMHVLDPQEVKAITKIEGDTVYFNLGDEDSREVSDEEKEKDADHVKSTAVDQAKKNIKAKAGMTTAPASPPKAPAAAAAAPSAPAAPAPVQATPGL